MIVYNVWYILHNRPFAVAWQWSGPTSWTVKCVFDLFGGILLLLYVRRIPSTGSEKKKQKYDCDRIVILHYSDCATRIGRTLHAVIV